VTTVLIIDDNQDHYILIERVLNRMNLKAMIAKNNQDILSFLEYVDLVILDLNLSDKWLMDSFEIISYIRNHDLLASLPILALATSVLSERKYQNGWNKLMMKPFDISELKHNILALVNH
jgi:DNA-binding response OmpR family regulator